MNAALLDDGKLIAAMVRNGEVIHSTVARAIREFGVSPLEVELLRVLAAHAGSRPARLADRLCVTRQVVARVLEKLDYEGVVDRSNHPDDRRAQQAWLTRDGEARLACALVVLKEIENKYFEGLSEADAKLLRGAIAHAAWSIREADRSG